jgi:hypothetical protein
MVAFPADKLRDPGPQGFAALRQELGIGPGRRVFARLMAPQQAAGEIYDSGTSFPHRFYSIRPRRSNGELPAAGS